MPDEEDSEERKSNRKVNRQSKKHTRREAIKYGAKVGFGAAIWGTVGNVLGRGYGAGRDFYRNEVKPTLDKVEKGTDKIKELGDDINRTFNPWYQPKPKEKKEQPKLTRRGFLRSLAWQAHEHPQTAGTSLGILYGGGKYALSGLSKYLTKREIARLKDESIYYKERIHILEKYQAGIEKNMEVKDAKVEQLQEELAEVKRSIERLKKSGKLEEKVEEGKGTGKKTLLLIGSVGLFISIILSSMVITGNAVLNVMGENFFLLDVILFFASLLLVFIGIKKR